MSSQRVYTGLEQECRGRLKVPLKNFCCVSYISPTYFPLASRIMTALILSASTYLHNKSKISIPKFLSGYLKAVSLNEYALVLHRLVREICEKNVQIQEKILNMCEPFQNEELYLELTKLVLKHINDWSTPSSLDKSARSPREIYAFISDTMARQQVLPKELIYKIYHGNAKVSIQVYQLTNLPLSPLFHSALRVEQLFEIHYWSASGVTILPLFEDNRETKNILDYFSGNNTRTLVSVTHIHYYKEIQLGLVNYSIYDIVCTALGMGVTSHTPANYNLLKYNCNKFTKDLCTELDVPAQLVPSWIDMAASVAGTLNDSVQGLLSTNLGRLFANQINYPQ